MVIWLFLVVLCSVECSNKERESKSIIKQKRPRKEEKKEREREQKKERQSQTEERKGRINKKKKPVLFWGSLQLECYHKCGPIGPWGPCSPQPDWYSSIRYSTSHWPCPRLYGNMTKSNRGWKEKQLQNIVKNSFFFSPIIFSIRLDICNKIVSAIFAILTCSVALKSKWCQYTI